jgi:hypothetical protein
MMINLIVLVILAACAAVMYLKGTLVQAAIMVFNALLAGFAALGFYEMLAVYLVKYVSSLTVWAPLIGFVLLFVVVFAVLQTVALQIHKEKTDMGLWPERIGRPVCGLLLGYVLLGNLLIAVAMAPIPSIYPYPRFGDRNPNPSQPSKPLFSPDGGVSGLFSVISEGSLSALNQPHSFGMVHAGFVDSLYLNRQKPPKDVSIATKDPVLEVPRKGGVWEAPATLRDAEGQAPAVTPDRKLMVVRASIKATSQDAVKFTLSQWRLVCAPRGPANALAGKGQSVYPMGFLGSGNVLVKKPLDELIPITPDEMRGRTTKSYDFVFAVPADQIPILLAFKQNNLVQLSLPISGDEQPAASAPEEAQAAPAQPSATPDQPAAAPRSGRGNQGGNRRGGQNGLSGASQNASGVILDQDINPQ